MVNEIQLGFEVHIGNARSGSLKFSSKRYLSCVELRKIADRRTLSSQCKPSNEPTLSLPNCYTRAHIHGIHPKRIWLHQAAPPALQQRRVNPYKTVRLLCFHLYFLLLSFSLISLVILSYFLLALFFSLTRQTVTNEFSLFFRRTIRHFHIFFI